MGPRRRSATVAMSVIGLSAVLGACDDAPQPTVYGTVADCSADHGAAVCNAAWQASAGEHQATAPQYAAQSQCEAEYGPSHCEPYSSPHGSVFVPLMAGFMIGRMMRRPDDRDPPNGSGGGGYVGHPVFYSASGGYSAPPAKPGEALFSRGHGFTERAGFGRSRGFFRGLRGG